jgi:uncharacterized membrane protein
MMSDTPPSPPGQRWRLKYGDQIFGPFERAELEELLAEGRLDRSSLLAEEGYGESWRPAGEFLELRGLFGDAPAPAKAKPPRVPIPGQPDVGLLHLIYALYAASFFVGITALAGVIVAYVKRDQAVGTWQESHYTWLIRTFWWVLAFMILGGITTWILIGFVILFLGGVWFIYRIVKGWLRLSQLRAIENPEEML